MSRRKKNTCSRPMCEEPIHLGGLCEKHYAEKSARESAREHARRVLFGLDPMPEGEHIYNEIASIRPWFDKSVSILQSNPKDQTLFLESESVFESSVTFCQEVLAWASRGRPAEEMEAAIAWRRKAFGELVERVSKVWESHRR